jgi:hypothetical protein
MALCRLIQVFEKKHQKITVCTVCSQKKIRQKKTKAGCNQHQSHNRTEYEKNLEGKLQNSGVFGKNLL